MNCSPANLASQAACYKSCLSPGSIAAIKNYLLCAIVKVGGIGANLIPTGATYSGGGSYTLTISANTTYGITWGANDTSATVGSTSYPSTGGGTQTTFYSSSNTTITFFGTGGSTVTAMLRVAPKNVPILTGLAATLNSAGTQITVSWDTPPSQITATNVYTSPDQVTWTLAATVNAPGASTVLAAPAVGSVLYIRAYWTSGIATNTLNPLTVNQPDPDVASWATRVVANGGAAVAAATVAAANTFTASLKATTVWEKLQFCNMVVPDNLKAACTPLIVGPGSSLWDSSTWAGTLGVNGLTGNGNQNHILCGNVEANFTLSGAGLVLYGYASNTGVANDTMGLANTSSFTDGAYLFLANSTNTQGALGSPQSANVSVAHPGNGYFSLQRTATNALALYWANSTHAHASIATAAGTVSVMTVNQPVPVFQYNLWSVGGYSGQSSETISFIAGTSGLSSSEDATLYNAVQALRTALGGGWV